MAVTPPGKARPLAGHAAVVQDHRRLPAAAVLGLALDDWIDAHFYNSVVVAVMLIVYGIAFILIERRPRVPTTTKLSRITYRQALIVGAWQVLAPSPARPAAAPPSSAACSAA